MDIIDNDICTFLILTVNDTGTPYVSKSIHIIDVPDFDFITQRLFSNCRLKCIITNLNFGKCLKTNQLNRCYLLSMYPIVITFPDP